MLSILGQSTNKTLPVTASGGLKAEPQGIQQSAPSAHQQWPWQGILEVQVSLQHPDIDPLLIIKY